MASRGTGQGGEQRGVIYPRRRLVGLGDGGLVLPLLKTLAQLREKKGSNDEDRSTNRHVWSLRPVRDAGMGVEPAPSTPERASARARI